MNSYVLEQQININSKNSEISFWDLLIMFVFIPFSKRSKTFFVNVSLLGVGDSTKSKTSPKILCVILNVLSSLPFEITTTSKKGFVFSYILHLDFVIS